MLEGKVCLVTGATGGIGRIITDLLLDAGAIVHATSTSREKLKAIRGASWTVADLSSEPGASFAVSECVAVHGCVDVLVNCAGVYVVDDVDDITSEAFDHCMRVNVYGPFYLCRAVLPGMIARGSGAILNVGSSSSYVGSRGGAAYCASKHALLGLSRALDQEARPHGVRVISISPASVDTAMASMSTDQDPSTFLSADEVADAAMFALGFGDRGCIPEIRIERRVYR